MTFIEKTHGRRRPGCAPGRHPSCGREPRLQSGRAEARRGPRASPGSRLKDMDLTEKMALLRGLRVHRGRGRASSPMSALLLPRGLLRMKEALRRPRACARRSRWGLRSGPPSVGDSPQRAADDKESCGAQCRESGVGGRQALHDHAGFRTDGGAVRLGGPPSASGGRALLLAPSIRRLPRKASSSTHWRTRPSRRRSTISTPPRAPGALEADLEIRLAGDFIFVNAHPVPAGTGQLCLVQPVLSMLRAFAVGRASRARVGIVANGRSSCACCSACSTGEIPTNPPRSWSRAWPRPTSSGLSSNRAVVQEHDPDAESPRRQAKRTYAHGVAVTKDVINRVRMGRTTTVASEAGGPADRGPGAQQRDLPDRADHDPGLRRVHLHPFASTSASSRWRSGKKLGFDPAAALRSRAWRRCCTTSARPGSRWSCSTRRPVSTRTNGA